MTLRFPLYRFYGAGSEELSSKSFVRGYAATYKKKNPRTKKIPLTTASREGYKVPPSLAFVPSPGKYVRRAAMGYCPFGAGSQNPAACNT
jgi:hypothetical protein